MKNSSSLIYCLILVLFLSCAKKEKVELLEHPNVLFISLDDMNDWTQTMLGNDQAITPNLLNFGKEAVNFKNNYCASPGCNPSRSATLTGIHTYNSGMYSNYQDWRNVPMLANTTTLNQLFKQNGYYTAGAGKIYHYLQVDSLGWDDYYPTIKRPMPKDNIPENAPVNMEPFKYMYGAFDWSGLPISDEETGDFESVNFISEQLKKDHDKPFFLAAGIYRPHLPWYVPQKYFDMFPLESIELPKTLEGDTTDLGNVAKELISRGGNYHKHVVEADQWKKAIQGYLASIAFADEMVGRLLTALSESPYADNTIVVIWSDHGWQLGEKMHWRKFALWENVTKTVMMMKVPKGIQQMPEGSFIGGESTNLTSLLDIYPTLVDLCGLPSKTNFDGVSLKSILSKPDKKVSRPIITTYDYGSYSIRFDNWHYIKYIDDSEELYNLENDPEEWHNLAVLDTLIEMKIKMASFIPNNPIDLPETSLLELAEHHIPPIRSREYFFSAERKEWMKRFEE
ncbi:sulfatase [Algoriphagus sp.]|uniref:sulfatase n=1 Tax=Algoriphagus sp. TaxID=1872435 RepID=UPI0025F85C41|nr:sulfatase [Algoriphagus sp.]